MRSVNTLVLGILLAASASSLLAQANPAGGVKVAPAAVKTSQQATKVAAKPKPKSAARKPVETSASPAGVQAPAEGEKLARRDPFESLINRSKDNGAGKNLPPGKAGLQVSTLRLDGIVRSSNGMIAVVSNPQARTYFLREGDQLYDGRVEKIAMDGVSFHELGKDAFGKPVERQVNKRIYASAGEQQ
jgi:Tfp pilus assembly protein PilP